jgi:hypothetical protein
MQRSIEINRYEERLVAKKRWVAAQRKGYTLVVKWRDGWMAK